MSPQPEETRISLTAWDGAGPAGRQANATVTGSPCFGEPGVTAPSVQDGAFASSAFVIVVVTSYCFDHSSFFRWTVSSFAGFAVLKSASVTTYEIRPSVCVIAMGPATVFPPWA